MEKKYSVWIEGTIVAALALVLSLIPLQIGSSFSISLGQIPLTLFALRRGWKAGLLSGFIWGILHFPTGQVYYLSVIQVLIEYPIAFTFAGFAGIFSKRMQKNVIEGNTGNDHHYCIRNNCWCGGKIFLALHRRCCFLGKLCIMGNESMDFFFRHEWGKWSCDRSSHYRRFNWD